MGTTQKTLLFFWQHAWKYPKYVLGLLLGMPITLLLHQFLPPLIIAGVLDRLSKGQFTPGDLWGSFGNDILLFALLIMAGGVVAWRIMIICIWKLEALVVRDIQRQVFNHVLGLDASFHANHFGGSLVSQANKLSGAYIRLADTTLFQVTTLLLSFIFTVLILFPRAPLFVTILVIFSTIYMASAAFITRQVRKLNAIEATVQNKQTGFLADAITNVLAIKSFAGEQHEGRRFGKATENTRLAAMDVMRAATKRDLYFSTVTTSIDVLAVVMAAASVVLFHADIATVFLVLTYTASIVHRLWEFSQNTLRNYNRALGDSQDMIEILHTSPEVKDRPKPEQSRIKKGAINLKNVGFTHDRSKDENDALFANLNINIKPGEKIGLVGHSGSGKTTFTRLLLRYSDIDSGEILIDGQNIAHISQDDLRRSIAYVPQEPLLFHRSLHENIAYGKPDASDVEIREAARKAHAAEFIEKLPQGYETLVGERGVKLSGGQRQRVAIARAMLKDAPILVLDEATSALDSESERLIQSALWELMKGRTAIVIAHRLSTIQKMDRIIVLENGQIIEEGTHAGLLKQKGTYADLWQHQSGGFIEE